MARSKQKNGSAETSPPTDFIPFEDGVREGNEILERERQGSLRLGEIADKLERKYADRTLAKFARAIGLAPCTVERHLSVYRAWKGKPARGPVLYGVLRALQDHPDRASIIEENPKLTQKEAQKMMCAHKEGFSTDATGKTNGKTDWDKHNRQMVKTVYRLARDACRAAHIIGERLTPEQKRSLLKALEVHSLNVVKQGGEALLELFDYFQALLPEEAQKVEHDRGAEAPAVH
jgi:hypothetical protein